MSSWHCESTFYNERKDGGGGGGGIRRVEGL